MEEDEIKEKKKGLESFIYYIGEKRMMALISKKLLKEWFEKMGPFDKERFMRKDIEDKLKIIIINAGRSLSGPVTWLIVDERKSFVDKSAREHGARDLERINEMVGSKIF